MCLMLLRMEMTAGKNLPWSEYQSRMRVEPIGIDRAWIHHHLPGMPTTEPGLVKGMLKGLILLSLQTLKHASKVHDCREKHLMQSFVKISNIM